MDVSIPYLRSQVDLLAELNVAVRDGSNVRWTAVEKYAALNQVLQTWADKVMLPHRTTITDGWVSGTQDYALPSYARPPFYPELLRSVPFYNYVSESLANNWQDVPGWEVVPDGSGGQVLRLFSPARNVEARVSFYAPNSRVPTTIPVTTGSTSASATTTVISTDIGAAIDDVGYIKCEGEWMGYAGVDRTATTTTLNNLTRALYGTAAAVHAGGSSVAWGVAMDDGRLHRLLLDMWRSALHSYFIQDGGTHERGMHEKGLGYYDSLAAWLQTSYRPKRQSQGLILNSKVFALRR
jgi:hypothetical protein